MAGKSNAQQVDSGESVNERIELEGLEGFFSDDHEELLGRGLTIKQAVFYYGETRKSLKAKVMDGKIPAVRLPESHGRKWRVFPDGVPPQLGYLVPKKLRSVAVQEEKAELTGVPAIEFSAATDVIDAAPPVVHSNDRDKTPPAVANSNADMPPPAVDNMDIDMTPPVAVNDLIMAPPVVASDEIDMSPPLLSPEKFNLAPPDKTGVEVFLAPPEAAEPVHTMEFLAFSKMPIAAVQSESTITVALETDLKDAIEQQAQPEPARKTTARYNQLQDKITDLEKQLADTVYRNNYLETRVAALEDQMKFVTQNHYQNRSYNKLAMILPALAILAAVLFFRLSGQL